MGGSTSVDWFTVDSVPDLSGKIAIVTGGNTGIGFAIAKGLAHKKATVIVASRNQERVEKAVEELKKLTGNPSVFGELVDLTSFRSITSFTESIARKYQQIDILINNAAVFVPRYSKTEEGLEITLGVNTFGSVLIIKKLLPLLKKAADARIVVMGSGPMSPPHQLFDRIVRSGDLGGEKLLPADTTLDLTALSKLFLTMYAFELQRRLLQEEGHQGNIFIANAFPGLVNSGGGHDSNPDIFMVQMFRYLAPFIGSSTETGSLSPLFLATAPKSLVDRYRGATAGPGPKVKVLDLGNPDLTAANSSRVFDIIEQIIESKL